MKLIKLIKLFRDKFLLNLNKHYYLSKLKSLQAGQTYGVGKKIIFVDQLGNPNPKTVEKTYGLIQDLNAANEFGTKDLKTYSYWAWRSCGVANVAMVLKTEKLFDKKLYELVKEIADNGGYLEGDRWGNKDIGWRHSALKDTLIKYGLKAKISAHLSIEGLISEIVRGRYVIASIKSRSEEKSGHIVLVTSLYWDKDNSYLNIYDPFTLDGKGGAKKISYRDLTNTFTHKGIITWI